LRASNYFDNKGFINTLSAVASGDDNTLTSSSCEGTPEITNTDVSVVENSSTDIPLLTIAHGSTDKSIQYGISGRDKKFFNLKGNVPVGLILKKLLLLPAMISKPVTMPVVATVPTGVR
jgi:hypothetical protein